jgi:hypothetical protein
MKQQERSTGTVEHSSLLNRGAGTSAASCGESLISAENITETTAMVDLPKGSEQSHEHTTPCLFETARQYPLKRVLLHFHCETPLRYRKNEYYRLDKNWPEPQMETGWHTEWLR